MKQRGMKILAMLLTLAMVVGLLPGMNLTAYALPTETLLTTITGAGSNASPATSANVSYSVESVATLTFSEPNENGSVAYQASPAWGWWGYDITLTVTPAEGYTITKCVFYDDKDRTATDSEAPFVVETTEEDKTPKVNGVPILANQSKGIKKIEVYGYATPTATHSVTITAGDHMTKTADSGDAEQTGLTGAMTDVVYTADNGYYYPTDYSVAEVSGIKVTRDSYTQITVSGTPTADAAIALTAPTAKTTPDAPTTAAAENCTTADNNDGKLTGVTTAMEYKKSDAADWTAGTGSDITGLVPGTYYVRVKATETTNASTNQELTIKGFISYTVTFRVVNGKWNEGEGDAATADKTVTLTGHDGDTLKLTADQIPAVGSKPNDTYKAGSWDVTPSTDTAITEATTYTYTYAQKDSISQTVTFKVVNGSWNDETTTDKTVTLTGYEGDTLKLAADQIPTVGTKPNDTYKAGSWDVTPSTETEITADTTYTYTYAQKEAATVTKAPEAKTLTYTGSAQSLVTAGEATGGTMQYAIGDANGASQPYTTSIPTATNAGTYYVWYKVVGDADHSDTAPVCVTVTIAALTEPVITGYALELGGVLGLRYYMALPTGTDIDYTDAKMTFSMNYREDQVILYSDLETDDQGRFFTCGVYAYQMADEITATFTYKKDGATKTLTDTYSVKQYLDSLKGSEYSGAALNLVNATRAYGHFIQPYLARVNGWTVGGKYAELDYTGAVNVNAALAGSEAKKFTLNSMDSAYVQDAYYRLLLNADTSFIVEVSLKNTPAGTVSMTIDGTEAAPTVSGTAYRVTVPNIAANNLAVSHQVVMKIGDKTVFDFIASPMSYVYTVLSKSSPAEDEQNALAALYEYWQAAAAYNGQN